ncbi:hypothetical protein TNCV_3324361 [Trichonephila clavipes]|nr:hypothetical protein TNCV_3324361 [Trichonephila clavipes]
MHGHYHCVVEHLGSEPNGHCPTFLVLLFGLCSHHVSNHWGGTLDALQEDTLVPLGFGIKTGRQHFATPQHIPMDCLSDQLPDSLGPSQTHSDQSMLTPTSTPLSS